VYDAHIDMKSFAPRFAVFLLPVILVLAGRQSRADMWCGDGPGTALSHPCTDADDYSPAVEHAVKKYQDRWMRLEGVWSVDEGDTYHNRVPNIEVHVEPASVASVRKKIPSSMDGIPVEIVPGEMPTGGAAFIFGGPIDPAERARRVRQLEDREKAREKYEPAYNLVFQMYGDRWDDLPGVIGMGPGKCDDHGCDFKTIEVTVQRELLPEARREIPSSVNGVRIVLVPED
jgi:hypothetical protein